MLNILQNPFANTESLASDTKCAEIHYITANFRIICQRCKDKFYDYQHFEKHFQDQHLYELLKDLTLKSDQDKHFLEGKEYKNEPLQSTNIAEVMRDCGEIITPHLHEENVSFSWKEYFIHVHLYAILFLSVRTSRYG